MRQTFKEPPRSTAQFTQMSVFITRDPCYHAFAAVDTLDVRRQHPQVRHISCTFLNISEKNKMTSGQWLVRRPPPRKVMSLTKTMSSTEDLRKIFMASLTKERWSENLRWSPSFSACSMSTHTRTHTHTIER